MINLFRVYKIYKSRRKALAELDRKAESTDNANRLERIAYERERILQQGWWA